MLVNDVWFTRRAAFQRKLNFNYIINAFDYNSAD